MCSSDLFVLPYQLRLKRLSLIRITPRRAYHAKKLIFDGSFIFQSFLSLFGGISDWIKALYMESTVNKPFWCRFQWKISGSGIRWIEVRRPRRLVHASNLVPVKSRLKVTFGGKDCIPLLTSPLDFFAYVAYGFFGVIGYQLHFCSLNLCFSLNFIRLHWLGLSFLASISILQNKSCSVQLCARIENASHDSMKFVLFCSFNFLYYVHTWICAQRKCKKQAVTRMYY